MTDTVGPVHGPGLPPTPRVQLTTEQRSSLDVLGLALDTINRDDVRIPGSVWALQAYDEPYHLVHRALKRAISSLPITMDEATAVLDAYYDHGDSVAECFDEVQERRFDELNPRTWDYRDFPWEEDADNPDGIPRYEWRYASGDYALFSPDGRNLTALAVRDFKTGYGLDGYYLAHLHQEG